MTGMLRNVRRVLLAALMASALMLGAVSAHAMAQDSVEMGSSGMHVMAGSDHSAHAGAMPEAMAGSGCDDACELGGALVTVLCVAAVVALAVLLFLPGAASARGILNRLVVRASALTVRGRPTVALSLTQLSISRT